MIQIDEKALQKRYEQKIDEKINETIKTHVWFVDVDRLVLLTGFSRRFLEEHVLSHSYMKAIERKKSRKRFYLASEALSVIDELTREW